MFHVHISKMNNYLEVVLSPAVSASLQHSWQVEPPPVTCSLDFESEANPSQFGGKISIPDVSGLAISELSKSVP